MTDTLQKYSYPISMLPTFVGQLDQLIEALENKQALFTKAGSRPGLLDEDTASQALAIFHKNVEHIVSYHEQLIKWHTVQLSETQRYSLDVFAQKIAQARRLNVQLIDLIKKLAIK